MTNVEKVDDVCVKFFGWGSSKKVCLLGANQAKTVLLHLFCFSPAFPSDPILEDPGPVLLGQKVTFHCNMTNVFTPHQLRVRWLRKNHALMTETFSFSGSLQNISSSLEQQVEEDHMNVTCSVELLTESRDVLRSRRTSVPLQVHCE